MVLSLPLRVSLPETKELQTQPFLSSRDLLRYPETTLSLVSARGSVLLIGTYSSSSSSVQLTLRLSGSRGRVRTSSKR